MSDLEPNFAFQEPEEDEVQYEFLKPGEMVPAEPKEEAKPAGLSEERLAELLKAQDPSAAITQGLGQLVEKISSQPAANQAPPVDNWDPEKLEEEFFAKGKTITTVEKVVQRVLGSVQGQVAVQMQQQAKKLLKVDPQTSTYFNKFEGEIEKRVQGLPPQYRFQPDIYEKVYQQMLVERQPEIIQAEAAKIAEAAVAKALADAGIKQPGAKAGGVQNEVGNSVVGGHSAGVAKKKVFLTATDRQNMMESLMDPSDTAQVKAYLRSKGRL
jgi:hypothetical protein